MTSAGTTVSSTPGDDGGRDTARPSVELLWAERGSQLQTPAAHPETEDPRADCGDNPTVAIAQAAGVSAAELAALQSLQNPAPDRARDTETHRGSARDAQRHRDAQRPTEEELRVFLGWCPLLRGGGRGDLTE